MQQLPETKNTKETNHPEEDHSTENQVKEVQGKEALDTEAPDTEAQDEKNHARVPQDKEEQRTQNKSKQKIITKKK